MENTISEARIIFNELQAVEHLLTTYGYDFDKLDLDEAFTIRRKFKIIIEEVFTNIKKNNLEIKKNKFSKMNKINNDFSFVVYDGSSYFVLDRQDKEILLLKDTCIEIVFKDYCLDKCQDEADRLNDLL